MLQLPLIAVGSGALLWLLITRLPATMGEMPLVGIWLQLILLAYMGAMIWLFVRPLALRWRTNAILLLLALFFLTILTIKLKNTPFTVGGINGDARFYTTYVTKLAAYPGYGDMFYKDLPAFYPPLYFWLVGRGADWFGIEPFRVMKTGLLVTVLILPLVTGALWRRLVDERLAAAVALCMLVFPDWFKPNEWLALALFVPWWLHWVDNVTAYRPATPRTTLLWWLSGGLIGALIFQLYFFWFFVGGVTLAVKVGWWLCCRRREHQLRWSLLQSGGMLTLTALLSAPFWVPYLYSLLTTPGAEPLQNRFFGESKIPLPLYFFEASWQGVVYMGGLLYLFLAAATNRVLWGLRWLVIGFAVWVVLGYVGILVDMPLLTFRSYPMLLYLLGASAFLGLFQLWHNAEAIQRRWPIFPVRTLATLLLLLVVLLFANGAVTELQEQENVQDALAATYPATELAAFDQLTAQTYLDRVVWVTDGYRSILFFRPVYSFLAWSAHFSHPAGQFHARADFLEKLAQLHDPALFAQAFAQNQYDRINYILLSRDEEYWRFSFVDDNFPNRMIDREINFPARLLAEPFFRASTVGEYTMLKPTVVEPLAMTPTATAAMSLDDVAPLCVDHALCSRYCAC
ncbi:MAG: arabinofuranosyltransferase [Caldilineaceae bacterium]